MIELVDWTIDALALLVSLFVAKHALHLSVKETVILVACCGLYAVHEVWEAGLVFPGTHRAFELWVVGVV